MVTVMFAEKLEILAHFLGVKKAAPYLLGAACFFRL